MKLQEGSLQQTTTTQKFSDKSDGFFPDPGESVRVERVGERGEGVGLHRRLGLLLVGQLVARPGEGSVLGSKLT